MMINALMDHAKKSRIMVAIGLLLSLVTAIPVFAQAPYATVFAAGEEDHGHGGGHPYHLAAFLGATTKIDANHTYPTLGIEAERKLDLMHGKVGVGLLAEAILADHTEFIAAVPLFYHATDALKLMGAFGLEFADDGHGGTHQAFLVRVGAGYDLHMAGLAVSPVVNVDYIGGHLAAVYGLTFGFGF